MRKLRDGATIDCGVFRYSGEFWLLDPASSSPVKNRVKKKMEEDKAYMERCKIEYNSDEVYIKWISKRNDLLQEWLDKGK